MYKENGRKKPADSKEMANTMGKVYECEKCGHAEMKRNVEFGGTFKCPKCLEGILVEKIGM